MKIRIRKKFIYTWDQIREHTLFPGVYEVPRQVDDKTAQLAISFGAAVVVHEPKPEPVAEPEAEPESEPETEPKPVRFKKRKGRAPENKAIEAEENK